MYTLSCKRTKYIMSLLLIITLMMTGCGKKETNEVQDMDYKHISQKDAKELMDTQEDEIILDVRTQDEYNQGHIPGAICVPNESIGTEPPEELPDKEQLILVYCRSGSRSAAAAQKLADLGYTNIQEFGGIITWKYDIITE